MGVEILKDFHKLWKYKRNEDKNGGRPDNQKEGGINHGGDGLAAQFFLLFPEGTDAPEDLFEHAAGLPGAHKAGIHGGKHLGMLFHGIGKTGAFLNIIAQLIHDLSEFRIFCLVYQGTQGAGYHHTRFTKVGQLPQHYVTIFDTDAHQRIAQGVF
ncbi:MAG: hypothetical protein BWY09_02520 [Candidatus Hydrogenedentes bacterium ADurb.Bin179]|nr:MAG: hypothetical protein BWY09_02520 [Candidatus Hydrogenedentes bacterium ADurb.Bin179]